MSEGVGGNYFVPLPWQQYKFTVVQVLTTQLEQVVTSEVLSPLQIGPEFTPWDLARTSDPEEM